MPFDINQYLGFHYRKTGKQSRKLLEIFIADGKKKGLPVGNIQTQLQALKDSEVSQPPLSPGMSRETIDNS